MSFLSRSATAVESTEPKHSGLFSRAFVGLLAIQLLFGLSYSTFLLLPKFLRVELHASATEIGRVSGAATVAAAMVAPFVGSLCKRFSRRFVLTIALIAEAVGALGFCIAPQMGPALLVLRALQGVAWVLVFNVTATWAADLVPSSKLAQAIGYLGSAMLVTNALAPGVAEPLSQRFGYTITFAAAAVTVLGALAATYCLEEPSNKLQTSPAASVGNGVLRAKHVLASYYGSFLLGAGIGAMFTYVQPYAIEKGATAVGGFFFGYVAAAIFVRLSLARLADRVGPVNVAIVAFAMYAVTVGTTSLLEPSWLVVCGVCLGTSHGLAYPALTAAGFSAVGPDNRSGFMGWYTFGFNLGFALTVLTLGPVVDAYGYAWLFTIVGVMIGSGCVALWLTRGATLTGGALLTEAATHPPESQKGSTPAPV